MTIVIDTFVPRRASSAPSTSSLLNRIQKPPLAHRLSTDDSTIDSRTASGPWVSIPFPTINAAQRNIYYLVARSGREVDERVQGQSLRVLREGEQKKKNQLQRQRKNWIRNWIHSWEMAQSLLQLQQLPLPTPRQLLSPGTSRWLEFLNRIYDVSMLSNQENNMRWSHQLNLSPKNQMFHNCVRSQRYVPFLQFKCSSARLSELHPDPVVEKKN